MALREWLGPQANSYQRYRDLLLPASVVALLARDQEPGNELPEVLKAEAKSEEGAVASRQEPAPATVPTKPNASSNRMRRVFAEKDVEALSAKAKTLPSRSDRRLTLDMLLNSGLSRGPVGMRQVARIPDKLESRLERLRREMPNFVTALDRIEPLLVLQRAGDGAIDLPPILLAGDPGVGKTFFAKRVAETLGLRHRVVSMENTSAGFVLAGTSLHWGNGHVGQVFEQAVFDTQANPLFILDEVDKAGSDTRYAPLNPLYALLEPGTAREFRDEACPDVPLDVSGFNWLLTANDLERVPAPLLNRMVVVHVPMPTLPERKAIAGCLYRHMRAEASWGKCFRPMPEEAALDLIARGSGSVRNMRSRWTLAFAGAFARGSRLVEVRDVKAAIDREGVSTSERRMGFV